MKFIRLHKKLLTNCNRLSIAKTLLNRIHSLNVCYSLLIFVSVWIVYGQTISFELITIDDLHFISTNPYVINGLTVEGIKWSFTTDLMGIWHPLTWLTYQLESSLFGADRPGIRHFTNGLLHSFNALLVFLLCCQFKLRSSAALCVALLFALHPQHVQAVAWISERKELLATFFVLLSLLTFLIWRAKNSSCYYWCSLFGYVCALCSKPSALPMLAIFIVVDVLIHKNVTRSTVKKRVGEYLPFVIIALLVGIETISIKTNNQVSMILSDGKSTMDALRWLSLIPLNLTHYLQTAILPWPLPVLIETPREIDIGQLCVAFLGIAVGISLWWRFRKSGPLFHLGILWFLAFWLPISGVISMGSYYVADRYMYQPHIGLFLSLVICVNAVNIQQKFKTGLLIGIVLILGLLTVKQVSYWKDSVTLFDRELSINPYSERAPIYAGWQKEREGDTDHALIYYDLAITNNPNSYYGYAYKGFLKYRLDHQREAIELFKSALNTPASSRGHYVNVLYEQLAWLLYVRGDYEEALNVVRDADKHNMKSQYLETLEVSIIEEMNSIKTRVIE